MTAVEIILLVIGIVFMIGSFFVTEKLSQKEITQISELSSTEMKRILEKNMAYAQSRMEELSEAVIEQSIEDTRRGMERETNLKIQNISEYAETVLEAINKNHSEVMFLYSMLNDKHGELTSVANRLESLRSEMEHMEEEVTVMIAESSEALRTLTAREADHLAETRMVPEPEPPEAEDEEMEELEQELSHIGNQNRDILALYQQNLDPREIARQLGLGVGEVKLVIDLYRGEGA